LLDDTSEIACDIITRRADGTLPSWSGVLPLRVPRSDFDEDDVLEDQIALTLYTVAK